MVEGAVAYPYGVLPQPNMRTVAGTGARASMGADVPPDIADMFCELMGVWRGHLRSNRLKYRYYDGKNRLKDYGISTPPELRNIAPVVDWPNKAVTALADRVRFDGFTAADGGVQAMLDSLTQRAGFMRSMRFLAHSEEIHGCYFATVSVDGSGRPRVGFHDAGRAAAVWDHAEGRIAYGLVIDLFDGQDPVEARVFTDGAVASMRRVGRVWHCDIEPIAMGRITMESFAYRPTDRKPFGQSRISRAVRWLTDSAVRVALGGDISYQFSVTPQKYLLGADRDAFGEMTKWEAVIGTMLGVGYNGKDGVMPQYGQLPQASMQPTIDYMRLLATMFSGATNIPRSQLGIPHDQPESAEAIYAANEALVIEASDLIDGNRETMRSIARMCVAAEMDVPLDDLTDAQLDIMPNYRNPAMPSVVSQADAAVKIASAVPEFAGTGAWWKMLGMPEDTRREIENETAARNAQRLFDAMFDGDGRLVEGGGAVHDGGGSPAEDRGGLARLNGSQMNVLVDLVTQAMEGTMGRDRVERLLRVGFKLTDDDIGLLFGGT